MLTRCRVLAAREDAGGEFVDRKQHGGHPEVVVQGSVDPCKNRAAGPAPMESTMLWPLGREAVAPVCQPGSLALQGRMPCVPACALLLGKR